MLARNRLETSLKCLGAGRQAAVASFLSGGHSSPVDVAPVRRPRHGRAAPARPPAAFSLVPVAYLIPVIIAATQWGIWPATLASVAGTGAADFFFVPPFYSFRVDDPQEAVDLLLFLVVALVSSNLASRLRHETETLRQREKEIQQLYEFSRRLAACFTVSDLVSAIQNYLSRALGQQAVFFWRRPTVALNRPNPARCRRWCKKRRFDDRDHRG